MIGTEHERQKLRDLCRSLQRRLADADRALAELESGGLPKWHCRDPKIGWWELRGPSGLLYGHYRRYPNGDIWGQLAAWTGPTLRLCCTSESTMRHCIEVGIWLRECAEVHAPPSTT